MKENKIEKKMEFALLITTPGYVHIFEEVLDHLDKKSLFLCPLVCRDWWQVIQNHPKYLRSVIRMIRIKKALVHSDFNGVMKNVEEKRDLKNLEIVLRQFYEEKQIVDPETTPFNMRDFGFFSLVFGDLQRLKYFWPYLPNKNPLFHKGQWSALHVIADKGI